MKSNRRLWIEDDIQKTSKATQRKDSSITYDQIFQQFSSRKPCTPLTVLCVKGLVVGQEFILSCLLLASHRVALTEESFGEKSILDDQVASILLAIWASFIFIVAFYGKPPAHSNTVSQHQKVRTRLMDAIFIAVLLRFLASVLRTLTLSYSSDTIYALAVASLMLHLLACDYNYANGITNNGTCLLDTKKRPAFKGGTLSLTTAFFATILLASRLEGNMPVYVFVSYSVILFALYPAARHQVAINTQTSNRWFLLPLSLTGMLALITFLLLQPIERILVGTVLGILIILVPLWINVLQRSKVQLRGQWDIAHVS